MFPRRIVLIPRNDCIFKIKINLNVVAILVVVVQKSNAVAAAIDLCSIKSKTRLKIWGKIKS